MNRKNIVPITQALFAALLFGASAPLAGVALSFLLLQETVGIMFLIALPMMVAGTFWLLYEKHDHSHEHEAVTHEHWHRHDDDHHHHFHAGEMASIRSHSHGHSHECCEHTHHHMPDIHHRHTHSPGI